MNRRLGACLTLGSILFAGFTNPGQSAAAASPQTDLSIAIHVYNYAEVSPKTLLKAENIAAQLFQKAGIKIQWLNRYPSSRDNEGSSAERRVLYPDVQVSILPHGMAERFG